MTGRSVATGLVAGAVIASFSTRGTIGRQLFSYGRTVRCFRLPSPGGIATLGDSITIGNSRPTWGILANNSWLSYAIAEGDLPYCYNAALPNQATEWIAARVGEVVTRRPDVLVILTGTNEVMHEYPAERAIDLIRGMVRASRDAGVVPVLATLPPITENVGMFNVALQSLADAERTMVIDFFSTLADGIHYRNGMSNDGLHPSSAGAKAMGLAAIPVLRSALDESSRTEVR